MSVSVDDLIASLSTNHIGQEATDLAALQSQLAQSLLTHHQLSLNSPHTHPSTAFVHGVSVSIARRDPSNVQHCTTPTARTPSTTFTWPLPVPDHAGHARKRSASSVRRQSVDGTWCDFEEMDEERIVEDMVTSDSPRSQNAYLWSSCKTDIYSPSTRVLAPSASTSSANSPTDLCPSSLFTSTDPFYLQASQSPQQSHSFFSHVGRPSSHSPFMMGVPSWE